MRLNCIFSTFAFILFFGLIGVFIIPAIIIYGLCYPFLKYPQDKFQDIAGLIYKIFFRLQPRLNVDIKLLSYLPESAIYVSTHQSNLDYPILGSFIKKYLIMTTMKFHRVPIIAQIGYLIGVRYLDKNNLGKINSIYNEFEKMLQENRNVIFFAEGTRSTNNKLGKFHKGAFRLAKKMNKPIIPIIIENSGSILQKGNFCFSSIKNTKIKVKMLEVIYPENFHNDDILEFTYNMMSKEFENSTKGGI